jgi:predicted transcriptional regulator
MINEELQKIEYTNIPSFVFKDRSLSVLEVMVEYLKDNKKLKFKDIASILNRDERTIWTVYRRAKLKRKGLIQKVRVDE